MRASLSTQLDGGKPGTIQPRVSEQGSSCQSLRFRSGPAAVDILGGWRYTLYLGARAQIWGWSKCDWWADCVTVLALDPVCPPIKAQFLVISGTMVVQDSRAADGQSDIHLASAGNSSSGRQSSFWYIYGQKNKCLTLGCCRAEGRVSQWFFGLCLPQ